MGGGGTGPPDGHWHTGVVPFHSQQRTPSAEPGGRAMSVHSGFTGGVGGGTGVGEGHARRSSTRSMVAEPLQPAVDKQATVQGDGGTGYHTWRLVYPVPHVKAKKPCYTKFRGESTPFPT